MTGRYRTIVVEPVCYNQLQALVPDEHALHDMLMGIEFVLSMQPHSGQYIGGPQLIWAMDCAIPGTDRSVALFYTIEINTVTLHRALLRAYGL